MYSGSDEVWLLPDLSFVQSLKFHILEDRIYSLVLPIKLCLGKCVLTCQAAKYQPAIQSLTPTSRMRERKIEFVDSDKKKRQKRKIGKKIKMITIYIYTYTSHNSTHIERITSKYFIKSFFFMSSYSKLKKNATEFLKLHFLYQFPIKKRD